ncbi:hypothetical protein BF49_1281 [Bradyrhizobium sp.]|nr:hypothetical protein BF49_1281 [Bradyrhizobium sp.]
METRYARWRPGLLALWDQGRKEHFHPNGKAYVETLGERD